MIETPPPFDALWFLALLGFTLGAVLGSFMTMLSYRIPIQLSLSHPRSCCPHCHHQLAVRDLIPILSFFLTKGRCRSCGSKISSRYPLIEGISGSLSALLFIELGFTPLLIPALLAMVVLMTICIIHVEKIIKN